MKIIYISNSVIPSRAANNIQKIKMCEAFSKNGHSVKLIVRNIKRGTSQENLLKFYKITTPFIIFQPFRGFLRFFSYTHALACSVISLIEKPDLVYSRFIHGSFFTSLLYPKVSIIQELHSIPNGLGSKIMLFFLIRKKNLKKIVVISEALKMYYQTRFNITDKLIMVAHDGADKPDKSTINNFSQKNKLHVGYIGHLYKGKGVEVIVDIAHRCSEWAHFHIVGGTDEDISFWKNKVGNTLNITFHGFIPPSETDKYRNSFDVLLAPYQKKVSVYGGNTDISKWMSPLKIFEYMAAGKPIICSDLPVLREVLTHGKTALLCDPGDTKQWINELKKLYDNKELRLYLGRSAQKEFEEKYTWNNRAKLILEGSI